MIIAHDYCQGSFIGKSGLEGLHRFAGSGIIAGHGFKHQCGVNQVDFTMW